MSDENHADTANTLDNVASTQPFATDAPAPTANPSSATDSSGNTVILNDTPTHTTNFTSTPTPSNLGPTVQK
jgi:hypothetical protein